MATYFDSSGVDLSGIVDGETIDANDVKLPLQALKDAVTDMDTMLGDGLVLDEQSTAPAAATGVVKLYVLGGKLYAKDANGQVYDLFSGGGTSTQAPIANAGADQTAQDSDDSGSESIQLDGSGSSDGDGTIVSYVWTEGGSQIATGMNPTVNLDVGTHTITLTVTDDDNETGTDTVVVTVNALSNQNPVANAGADQTVQDSDDSGSESVTLDGSGSSDSDGTIVSYVWTEGGSQIATGVNPTVNLAVGTHTITLTVTDDDSATATDTVVITISPASTSSRVTNGLLALYEFNEGSGSTVTDTSGVGTPLNLTIANPGNVSWGTGSLAVNSSTLISSSGAASKLNSGIMATDELTFEAWVTAANITQTGPARMVTLSADGSNRNATLAQGATTGTPASYDARVRSTLSNDNGTPAVSTADDLATTTLKHVVMTRDSNGNILIYVDGAQEQSHTRGGDLSNWNTNYAFGLANEMSSDRPWLGTFHLVAVYDRALSSTEVQQNFNAGA